jgi:hypothetical protein
MFGINYRSKGGPCSPQSTIYRDGAADLRARIRPAWGLSGSAVWGEMERRLWGLSSNIRCIKWWIISPRINLRRNVKKLQINTEYVRAWSVWLKLDGDLRWRQGPHVNEGIRHVRVDCCAAATWFAFVGVHARGHVRACPVPRSHSSSFLYSLYLLCCFPI